MQSNELLNASIFASLCSAKMKNEILVFFFLHLCSRQLNFASILLFLHTQTNIFGNLYDLKLFLLFSGSLVSYRTERKRVQHQQSLQQRLSADKFPPIFNEFSILWNMLKAKAWWCDVALHQLCFYQHDFVNVIFAIHISFVNRFPPYRIPSLSSHVLLHSLVWLTYLRWILFFFFLSFLLFQQFSLLFSLSFFLFS